MKFLRLNTLNQSVTCLACKLLTITTEMSKRWLCQDSKDCRTQNLKEPWPLHYKYFWHRNTSRLLSSCHEPSVLSISFKIPLSLYLHGPFQRISQRQAKSNDNNNKINKYTPLNLSKIRWLKHKYTWTYR